MDLILDLKSISHATLQQIIFWIGSETQELNKLKLLTNWTQIIEYKFNII